MAKIQIKSEKLTFFGGIFPIMEKFDSILSSVIDSTLTGNLYNFRAGLITPYGNVKHQIIACFF